MQVPGYLAKQDELKAKGVAEVLVYCVNDGAVMKGWADDQNIAGSMITFLADTRCEFTKAVGMVMNHPGPMDALGNERCKRFAIIADDGVVKNVELSEAEGDPAGDNDPTGPVTARTLVGNILSLLSIPAQAQVGTPIKAGDTIPAVTIDYGFNPIVKVNMADRCRGKKVIIIGLPGAFTPC